MSFYGMMFGESVAAATLLSVLGLTRDDFYRYRDCYLAEDGKRIAVYTRGGGGNRECYCDDYEGLGGTGARSVEAAGALHLANCVKVYHATNHRHPCYLDDEDDAFDSTYATFYFRIPEEADRAALAEIKPEIDRDTAWQLAIAALHQATAQRDVGEAEPRQQPGGEGA